MRREKSKLGYTEAQVQEFVSGKEIEFASSSGVSSLFARPVTVQWFVQDKYTGEVTAYDSYTEAAQAFVDLEPNRWSMETPEDA